MENDNDVIEGTTCFATHAKHRKCCSKKSCKYWVKSKEMLNCSIVAAAHGPLTLQQIGDIFGLTRMRVCQIEKNILRKINESLTSQTTS